jgi:hypothetical protein
VFRAIPVILAVGRIEFPSTKHRTTFTRSNVLSVFMVLFEHIA